MTLGLKNHSNVDQKMATQVYTDIHHRRMKLEMAKYQRHGADYSLSISPKLTLSNEKRCMRILTDEKYKKLQKEMKTTYRLALLYPTFFMIRRILYSVILVFLFGHNYFQI